MTSTDQSTIDAYRAKSALELSVGFSRGNFDSAYHGGSLEDWLAVLNKEDRPEPYRQAYVLGFLASLELHEMAAEEFERFQEAYFSLAGQACLACGFMDPVSQEEWEKGAF